MNAAKAISEKTNSQAATGCLVVFGLIFLLGGLVGFWFSCLHPSLRSYQARSWPMAEATITHSKIRESRDEDGTNYSPEVHFTYTVVGQAMESEAWSFSVWSGRRTRARDVVDRYPVGSKHTCFYNPRKPGDAVLDRSFQWGNLAGLFLLGFAGVGGGALWYSLRMRRVQSRSGAVVTPIPAIATDSSGQNSPFLTVGESADDRREAPWTRFEGPQRLKPAMSRTARFVGLLLFALFWNGFSWLIFINVLRADGWLSVGGIFLTVFVAIGAAAAVGVVYMFLCLFNPVIAVALSNGAIPIGDNVDIAWETEGNAGRISELKIDLVGQETATYQRGTSTYTDKKEFARFPVTLTSDTTMIQFGSQTLQIPVDTMHSFAGKNNKIEWAIEVHANIAWWPDVQESMPLAVKPFHTTGPTDRINE